MWLGAAARRAFGLLAARHSDRFLGPRAQRLGVLEEVVGDLVVLHDLAVRAVGPERAHAPRREIRPIGVIDLEVERVVSDESEEALARVDADAAEHAAGADPRDDA